MILFTNILFYSNACLMSESGSGLVVGNLKPGSKKTGSRV